MGSHKFVRDSTPVDYWYNTVRVGPLVPREARAIGTVRVHQNTGSVSVGIVTEAYTRWDGDMMDSQSWSYWKGYLTHNGRVIPYGVSGKKRQATSRDDITVVLREGRVTFSHKDKTYSFELPMDCGRISLAVTLYRDATATIVR